jgi:hypothetical protein
MFSDAVFKVLKGTAISGQEWRKKRYDENH